MAEKASSGVDDENLVTIRWPEEGADDETRARVLARNMAENGGMDRTVAEVYAFRSVLGFPRGRTARELDLETDRVGEHLATARDRIREARGLLEAIEVAGERGEGFDRKTIRTAVPRSEYRPMHDDFESSVLHDRGESLAGQLFADEDRDGVGAVFVAEQAGERTDEGAPGYVVERLAPSGEHLGQYAVAAEYLQKRIDAGKLVPAKLGIERTE